MRLCVYTAYMDTHFTGKVSRQYGVADGSDTYYTNWEYNGMRILDEMEEGNL